MTQVETAMVIKILEGAYHKVFDEDQVKAYTVMLEDIPFELAKQAVAKLIKTSKWLPTIAEIREAALELVDPLPPVDLAYEEARQAARSFTPYAPGSYEFSHPLIRKAVDIIGLETLAYSEQPSIVAAQFRSVYERLREAESARRREQPILPGPEYKALGAARKMLAERRCCNCVI